MSQNQEETQWRTPDGIMRRIRLRKGQSRRASLSTLSLNVPASSSTFGGDRVIENNENLGKIKRQNPFATKRFPSGNNEDSKKCILSSEYGRSRTSHSVSALEHRDETDENCDQRKNDLPFIYLEEDSIQGIFMSTSDSNQNKHNGKEKLPVDWTIKRKVRILSSNTFAWCGRIKGAEDANAIARATRCHHEDIGRRTRFSDPSEDLQKSWRIELGKCLTYWQQPSIPWLSLFPRYGQSTKLQSGTMPAIPMTEDVAKAIHDSWVVSFRSILQLSREKLCPYFYVSAQQYTALFRAPSINGEDDITCTLTPTTVGLRQLLKSEGIKFIQPINKDIEISKENEPNQSKKEEKVDEVKSVASSDQSTSVDEIDGANDESTWDYINQNIKLAGPKETARTSLNAETSTNDTIIVKGNTNIQLLFNYLVNSKNSITKSGSQAHVPPTILAPVAFEGATLKKLSARSGIARSYSESSSICSKPFGGNSKPKQYSLDILGPLMPHCIMGLEELLKETQGQAGFKAALSTSLYTVPFNAQVDSQNDTDGQKFKGLTLSGQKFGMSEKVTEILQVNSVKTTPTCLNRITLSNGLYTWNE